MTEIIPHNKTDIVFDVEYLEDALHKANYPDGKILLILNNDNLPDNCHAVCLSSELTRFNDSFYHDLLHSTGISLRDWDCCVVIAKDGYLARKYYLAYFDYLIGHELGHAYIALEDLNLGIHCALVFYNIKIASKNAIQLSYKVPCEKRCDQFGIFLSHQIRGKKIFNNDVDMIKTTGISEGERTRLDILKGLTPLGDMNGLRNELIDFTLPYKDELIRCWEKDLEQYGDYSLASRIDDLDALFIKY